jgi:D-aminoacyl-tRNA deacylase
MAGAPVESDALKTAPAPLPPVIAVVVSHADRASEQIGDHLLDLADWTEHADPGRSDAEGGGTYYRTEGFELRTFDDLHLDVEGAADAFDQPDVLFFASRHSGETGPLLTAHATGNVGQAEFGGRDCELARAAPTALAALVDAFDEYAPDGYDVGIECTHHGPSRVGCPSLFVELGSGEAQWDDPAGAEAVARAILDCRGVEPDGQRALVGFGGGHYAPRFERVLRETDWTVGHVASDWALDAMGDPRDHPEVVAQVFERSGTAYALVDGDYPEIRDVAGDLGYRVVGETWVRETDGVPLETAADLEEALRPVDEGLRFGDPADGFDGDFAVASLPAELLDEAVGVDRERVRAAVAARALAFETEEGGTRVVGRAAVADADDRAAIVDDLASVLERKYDDVEREADRVVAREVAFDPAKAEELGVPEGPAFGRLASGEPVKVDGDRVAPEDVRTAREHEFPR